MPSVLRHNRISAFLAAILYVALSTIGAVGHTHASLEQSFGTRSRPASAGRHQHSVAAAALSAPHDCAACALQSMDVKSNDVQEWPFVTPTMAIAPSATAEFTCTASDVRSSSRAPPAV